MLAGRAAAVNHATKKQRGEMRKAINKREEKDIMNRYGLQKVPDDQLKQFKPEPRADVPLTQEQIDKQASASKAAADNGEYDHHAEIMKAKQEMEMKEQAQIDSDDEETGSINIDKKKNVEVNTQYRLARRVHMTKQEEEDEMAQIGIKQANDSRIVFRKMPFSIWIAGFMIIAMAMYLIYHLALGQYGVLFDGYREGHWWQYFLSVLILIFGVVFMHAGKVETLVLDKQTGILSKIKTSIFCKKKKSEWALEQVRNIRIYKRGHDGVQVMTMHYEVQFDFEDIPSQSLLQTQDKDKAIKQLTKIKDFLGLPISKYDLNIFDETTRNYNRGRKYRTDDV